MKVWTIKLTAKGMAGEDYEGRPTLEVKFVATRAKVLKELERCRRKYEVELWSFEAVFGLYVEQHEKRFRRRWGFSAAGCAPIVGDVRALIRRQGKVEAVRAIEALFTRDETRWVTSQPSMFLGDKDKYERYVVPLLVSEKAKKMGEQAEWKGERGPNSSRTASWKEIR